MFGRIFSSLPLSLAGLLIRIRLFDHAQALYIHELNGAPEGIRLCRVLAGLALTEYHREHFLNSRHYAQRCLEQIADGAVPEEEPGAHQVLDQASWYYKESQEAVRNLRRVDIPTP